MGEKANLPEENMSNDLNLNENDINEMEVEGNENDSQQTEGLTEAEYKALDKQLNALNAALDNVEQRNDVIFAQLQQLLESNREIRHEMEQSKKN